MGIEAAGHVSTIVCAAGQHVPSRSHGSGRRRSEELGATSERSIQVLLQKRSSAADKTRDGAPGVQSDEERPERCLQGHVRDRDGSTQGCPRQNPSEQARARKCGSDDPIYRGQGTCSRSRWKCSRKESEGHPQQTFCCRCSSKRSTTQEKSSPDRRNAGAGCSIPTCIPYGRCTDGCINKA